MFLSNKIKLIVLSIFTVFSLFHKTEGFSNLNNYKDTISEKVLHTFEITPSKESESLTLKISTEDHENFTILDLGWQDIASLHLKVGDLISSIKGEVDFSNYGERVTHLTFNSSNITLNSTSEKIGAYMEVTNLLENETEYTFSSELQTAENTNALPPQSEWKVEKDQNISLENNQRFFIDLSSENFIPDYIGKSTFSAYSVTGDLICTFIGNSVKPWEPADSEHRVFTIVTVDPLHQCYYNPNWTLTFDNETLEEVFSWKFARYIDDALNVMGHRFLLIDYTVNKEITSGYPSNYEANITRFAFYDIDSRKILKGKLVNKHLDSLLPMIDGISYKIGSHIPVEDTY